MSDVSGASEHRRVPAGGRPAPPVFAGRGAELRRIEELLGRAPGVLQVILVEGPAGIGKSRLLGELSARAELGGARVLAGSATEFEQVMPFAMFLDTISTLAWPGADDWPSASGADRFRLYREIREALAAPDEDAGAIIVLDDVQWADEASLGLLEFLLRRPPTGLAGLVLSHRTGMCPHRLTRALRALEEHTTRIRVPPLRQAEIDLLLPDQSAARRRLLAEASAGNPLYLRLLAQMPTHALPSFGGAAPGLDEAVAGLLDETIRADLAGLEGDENLVIRAAAVGGAEVDTDLAAAIARLPEDRVLEALDTLAARGLMLARHGRFRFAHPLLRAAAYRLSGPGRQIGAHRRAAEHLARIDAPLMLRAQHLQYALRPGDTESAAQLARAARSALASAPAASAQWFAAVLAVLPETPGAQGWRTELQILLARALLTCGRLEQADTVLQSLLARQGPGHRETVTLLAQCNRLRGRSRQAYASLETIATDSAAADSALILVELAFIDLMNGRIEQGAERLRHFAPGDERPCAVETAATVLLAFAAAGRGEIADAVPGLEAAGRAVDAMGDDELRTILDQVVPALAWGTYLLEHHDRALSLLTRSIKVAQACGHAYVLPHLYTVLACTLTRSGRLAEAMAAAEDAEETAAAFGATDMAALARSQRLRALLWMKGPEAVRELWEHGLRAAAARLGAVPAAGRHHHDRGRPRGRDRDGAGRGAAAGPGPDLAGRPDARSPLGAGRAHRARLRRTRRRPRAGRARGEHGGLPGSRRAARQGVGRARRDGARRGRPGLGRAGGVERDRGVRQGRHAHPAGPGPPARGRRGRPAARPGRGGAARRLRPRPVPEAGG